MEEDDEFDWEAAVQQIDVACQGAGSTSNREILGNSEPFVDVVCDRALPKFKKPCAARQSTLDMFVQTDRKHLADSSNTRPNGGSVSYGEGDDRSPGAEDETLFTNIDLEAAKTWIYPVNVPMRDYQLSITKTALFSNTLVSLPTGLGKTLIAAVVMYNYFRWFPEGKIVFTAPSRPLVMQQIEACHNIVGIPQEWTIDMTGQMNPSKRSHFWKSKRVFFVTPQVLEKDIQSGTCLVKQVVCLVIDEAHRATGNYSYCVAVRELMAVPVQLRILALTATPGSKQVSIQNVIDNLHISTLEYRSDTHHDVIPYIHNRKLELVKVTMGKDAVGINDLLLEAIQPFVVRLCAVGVLYKRDIATWSPCDLLNSRDKFRQAPPTCLPQAKYGEIEGCFGVLITLYHIRKLLSSHGIRPAYEMLEEKLQQGSFARFMSKNEIMWRVKLLMQQSLCHGAPSPKLLKMSEVLVDHFKTKGSKDSRVIIFSNFRGSVKDIMGTLSNLGDFVKATQFIGQSSGKSLKGQSQKVQQEVLQKFRSGGYNVIVATSIGEEGLDIMEVDLVICFDANISPLRMIQRMGRTGRKHDGRVVVLACEGAELKGYLKKQANSKAIRKHMHNGGINSFAFHPSPRMVPHSCKPEVQFVELSIEKFVPRGRKVKEIPMHGSTLGYTMSEAEMDRIAKYFHSSSEDPWRPSLIAFPHFQAFPSSVYKVMHSFRTTAMLVDAVQSLQGLPSFKANQDLLNEVEHCSSECIKNKIVAQDDNHEKDLLTINNAPTTTVVSEIEILDVKASQKETSKDIVDEYMPEQPKETPAIHCFLFDTDFVSVNAFGRVLISSVPFLPVKGDGHSSQNVPARMMETPRNVEQVACAFKTSPIVHEEVVDCDANPEQMLKENMKLVLNTPLKVRLGRPEHNSGMDIESSPDNYSCAHSRDMELSPRLTNFIENGVVPESPIDAGHCCYSSAVEQMVPNNFSSEHCKSATHMNNYNSNIEVEKNPADVTWHSPDTNTKELPSPKHNPCNIPSYSIPFSMKLDSEKNEMCNMPATNVEPRDILGSPIIEEIHTPLPNKRTNSSSEDWCLGSEEASRSIKKGVKFRRLCKYGDAGRRVSSKSLEEASNGIRKDLCMSLAQTKFFPVKDPGKQKSKNHARAFIEEEAEVSSDAVVSEDEEDGKDDDEYDDSFIDDKINPTSNTQKGATGSDMLAFYRRSLLTQSPIVYQSNCSNSSIHESTTPTTVNGRSCSKNIDNSLESQTNLHSASQSDSRKSASCQMVGKETTPQRESLGHSIEGESRIKRRKKKLFHQVGSDPEMNLCQVSPFQLDVTGKASLNCPTEHNELNANAFYDDDFYEGLDLDAVEAQATVSLMGKSKPSAGKRPAEMADFSFKVKEDWGLMSVNSPSFDLGLL